jgi:hypothetical protein
MSYPYEEYFKQPHKCQQRPTEFLGELIYDGKLDLDCVAVCKCGTHYNEFFQNKPTREEITQTAKAFYIKGLRATQIAQERKRNLFSTAQEAGQIITINFDKETPNIIDLMDYCINEIKKAGYAWLHNDALFCYEFYSSLSPNTPNNPHIHIATKRMLDKKGKLYKATGIAQLVRRKFSKDSKTPIKAIYAVNGEERTWKIAKAYVDGTCASKSEGADGKDDGDKYKYTKQDIKYRTLKKIEHPQYFN